MDRFPILLVEDNADDERLARRALRCHETVDLHVARDGQEAVDLLGAEGEFTPSLVILDLKLPKIGGLKVLEWIRSREHLFGLPVVILSSSDEPRDRHESQRLHANSFIQKPIDFDEFVSLFERMVEYWQKVHLSTPAHPHDYFRLAS